MRNVLTTLLVAGAVAGTGVSALAQSPATAPTAAVASAPVTAAVAAPAPTTDAAPAAATTAAVAVTAPAAAPEGRIQGVVIDELTGDTLIDARVTVEESGASTVTDLDGRYELTMPPGSYTIKIVNPPYNSKRISKVEVKEDYATVVDVVMSAEDDAVETVAVEADPDRTRSHIQLLIRKKAAVVSDILSSEEMSKGSDGTASEAVRRATGASVVDGKYIYVRGLGERYSYSMLNDSRLPSPEPDKQVVPLDLFPTGVLSNVTIVKTATPELPGDFTGGAVKIETKQFPEQRLLNAGLSLSGNSITTFRSMLSYKGSSTDYLGFDSGMRAFPETVPENGRLFEGSKISSRTLSRRDMALVGRQFNNDFSLTKETAVPGFGAALSYGDTFDVAGNTLGALASVSYSNSFQRTTESQTVFRIQEKKPNGDLVLDEYTDYEGERGTFSVAWSGLANLSYKLGRAHKLAYTTLYTLTSDKEARHLEGTNDDIGSEISYDRLYYLSRSLWFNQLAGEHDLSKVSLDWRASYSEALREEPDLRELTRVRNDDGRLAWYPKSSSGGHFFSEMVEPSATAGINATIPFEQWSGLASNIKLGVLETRRWRRFDVRRFRFLPTEQADPNLYLQDPEAIFADRNIGNQIVFEEASRSSDNYRASLDVHAGFAMTDLALTSKLRFIGGLRVEQAAQEVITLDPFAASLKPLKADLNDTDLLPSANVVYAVTDTMNIRAGGSRTVARPEFRELAPFSFADFYGGQEVYGNPSLTRTSIQNYDLRWELFPDANEVLAVSAFYKLLKDPIEEIIIPSSTLARSFANADRASNLGLEFEARRSFKFLNPALQPFYGASNVTLVRSRVNFTDTRGQAQTNTERPLQGQSNYLVNAALGYSGAAGTTVQATYNLFGKRIAQVGALGMPDVYEVPRDSLDAAVLQKIGERWEVKASAENLLDEAVTFKQGDKVTERSYKGINYGLGVSFKL